VHARGATPQEAARGRLTLEDGAAETLRVRVPVTSTRIWSADGTGPSASGSRAGRARHEPAPARGRPGERLHPPLPPRRQGAPLPRDRTAAGAPRRRGPLHDAVV